MKISARLTLSVLCLPICVGGCSDVVEKTNPDFSSTASLLAGAIGGHDISSSQAAAIPYATIGVTVGGGGQQMFVLAAVSKGSEFWVAGKRLQLTLRGGRIARTAGFVHNLTLTRDAPSASDGARDYLYAYDEIDALNVAVRCEERDAGAERIEILDTPHDTRHVAENCEAPQLHWRFTNDFWKDAATGYIWKSRQYFQPYVDALTIESLRPAKT